MLGTVKAQLPEHRERQHLLQEMVGTLARQSGALLGEQTPQAWLWQGRHVKLADGTTVSMPDTAENQARFPQHGQQEPGAGFPLVGVIALSNGAVLDAGIGPYQGKGTGSCFGSAGTWSWI